MSDDTNFVPRLDGTGSLGRTDKRWNEVHAKTYHGDGSNLTGITIDQVTGAAPADNYLTVFEQDLGNLVDVVGVGNTVTVDTDLTYTPGQYITITLREDNSLNQLSRVVSYNALSGQLQYAAPYSMGAGVANGNTSHEGPWDINIAETPTPRYTAQSTANGLRTTPTPGQPGTGGNALGFGAAGQITLGFDLQYEAGDYVKMAEYDDLSDYQIAEVVSYDTETGILVFDTPTIVEGSTSAHDQIFTATLAVAEEVRATAAEETLQANIDAEETARIAADANLQTQISNIGGSGLTNWTETNGHLIPDTDVNGNPAYDLGNASNKVRHLFLSDNSLWVGENHKISIDGGEMKFRKRKTDNLPLALRGKGIADDPGSVSLARLHELADLHSVSPETLFDGDDFDDENNAASQWTLYPYSATADKLLTRVEYVDLAGSSETSTQGNLLFNVGSAGAGNYPSTSGEARLNLNGQRSTLFVEGNMLMGSFNNNGAPDARLHLLTHQHHDVDNPGQYSTYGWADPGLLIDSDDDSNDVPIRVRSRSNAWGLNLDNDDTIFLLQGNGSAYISGSDSSVWSFAKDVRVHGELELNGTLTGPAVSSLLDPITTAITTEETRAAAAETANATAITAEQTRAEAAEAATATAIAALPTFADIPTDLGDLTNDASYLIDAGNGGLHVDISSERAFAENFEGLTGPQLDPGNPSQNGTWENGIGNKDGSTFYNAFPWAVTGSSDYHTRGPSNPYSGDKYIYTECTGRRPGKFYALTKFIPAAENIVEKLSFYYFGHGVFSPDEFFWVYLSETGTESGGHWTKANITKDVDGTPSVVDFLGEEQDSQSESWKRAEVDLSAYEGKDLYIRLVGKTGGSSNGEFAIDYIDFEIKPFALYSSNGAVQATEFIGDGSKLTGVGTSNFDGDYNNLTNTPDISTMIATEVNGIVDNAPAALNTLNEIAAAIADDANIATTLTTAIATEEARAIAAEATNANTIHLESMERIAEDTATRNMIPDVSGFATTAQIPDVSGFATTAQIPDVSGFATTAEIPDVSGFATTVELTAEETRATAAEAANATAITAEETRATAAEAVNATAITAEETRATAAEAANATAITAEETRATAAEVTLQESIDDKSSLLDDNDVARVEVLTDNTVVRSSTGVGVGNTEMTLTQGSAELNSYMHINPSLGGMALRCDGDVNFVGNVNADGEYRLNNSAVGGLSIAETYIHNTSSGTGTSTRYELTTAYQKLSSNHEVNFTAPANGKVKVKFIGMFSGIDSSVGTAVVGEEVYVRVKNKYEFSYIQDTSGVTWDGNKFMQTDESGNHTQLIEANVAGLTPGQSYTFEFEFKKGSDNTDVNLSFGADFAPTIIRVETLGTVTSHTS